MCKCFGWVGENREGMETGDVGWEDGGAAICVAPAKGATKPLRKKAEEVEISIHAPAKGATSVDAISSG